MGNLSTTADHKITGESAGRQRPAGPLRRWGKLAGWVFLIWFFIFAAAPWLLRQVPAIKVLADYIEESGIDAGAIYYTEVEEVGDADLAVRNTFRFYLDDHDEPADGN